MQNSNIKPSFAHRAGHLLGSAVSGYLNRQAKFARWISSKGVPARLVRIGLWGLNACLVAALFYGIFWFAFFAIVVVMIWVLLNEKKHTTFWNHDEEVGFDTEALFPDPYAPENIFDPSFNHDDA
jgi:hypothetical protein